MNSNNNDNKPASNLTKEPSFCLFYCFEKPKPKQQSS